MNVSVRRSACRFAITGAILATTAVALATGCGFDNSLVDGACSTGFAWCSGACVDLSNDPANCGACGNACSAGVACMSGKCSGASGGDAASSATGDATVTDGGASTGDDAQGANDPDADSNASGDSGTKDGAQGDATSDDASIGDASSGDATSDDATGGDASSSDATSGDASSGDASSGDATSSDASSSDANNGDASSSDATSYDGGTPEGGLVCGGGLVACAGVCVDTTTDPVNCGACGAYCVTGICQSSQCVGIPLGSIAYVGHDYAVGLPPTSVPARVLTNAVLALPLNPVRVLSFEKYASAAAVSNVRTLLAAGAGQRGSSMQIDGANDEATLPHTLLAGGYGVLLVLDQRNAPPGTLAAMGTSWRSALASFTHGGGSVVILDGADSTGEMPAFVSGTGLLTVTAHAPLSLGTPLDNVAPGNVVGVGVLTPYAAVADSVHFTTEPSAGDVTWVIVHAASGEPVVVQKVAR